MKKTSMRSILSERSTNLAILTSAVLLCSLLLTLGIPVRAEVPEEVDSLSESEVSVETEALFDLDESAETSAETETQESSKSVVFSEFEDPSEIEEHHEAEEIPDAAIFPDTDSPIESAESTELE